MKHINPVSFEPPSSHLNNRKKNSSFLKWTIILFIVFLIAIVFFLFSTKSIKVNTNPATADININTAFKLNFAGRYLLLKDDYNIEIKHTGYHTLTETLSLSDDKYQDYEFELNPLPGNLLVKTNSNIPAKIYLNDIEQGNTPNTLKALQQGEYKLRVEAERYFPFEDNITVQGLGKTQELNIQLQAAWATVSFASTPDAATVIVDEEILGETPIALELLEGKREISVSKNGFKVWKKTLTVTAQEDLEFLDITLSPADATVKLNSSPDGANVTLNDNYVGQTPLTLSLTPNKTARLRLYKQGYLAKTTSLKVKSGENKQLNLKMLPELVEVNFTIQPEDAELFINNKKSGITNGLISLPTTTQNISVRKSGYVEQTTSITPRHGIAQEVKISLKTLKQQRQENIKPIYTNSIGQQLKLFYPHNFTMGASRREPGRRANEAMRTVSLNRPFYLATHETTNAQFRRFQSSHNSGSVQGNSLNSDQQPVASITWEQAAQFCNWLSQQESLTPFYTISNNKVTGIDHNANGYRLPTEAEWAWAARARSKNETLKFSWGDIFPPPAKAGNFADVNAAGFLGKIVKDYDDDYAVSAPIGKFTANHKGLYDIDGNVAEWVHDYYSVYANNSQSGNNPLGPKQGEFHVIRGASWSHGSITELRLSYRDYASKAREDVGFRVARYLEQ